MHEISIVEALIDQVRETLEQAGEKGPVLKLELSVGRLAGVNCDSVRFAFELLSPGTVAEGAEVVIHQPRATCVCRACGERTEIDELTMQCPRCGSGDISIEGGGELMLQGIDVED